MTCCFFGHSNCPDNIRQNLKDKIVKIMGGPENVMFYVGHQGQFDSMVRSILKELIKEGMEVNYAVVLAYCRARNTSLIHRMNMRILCFRKVLKMFILNMQLAGEIIG